MVEATSAVSTNLPRVWNFSPGLKLKKLKKKSQEFCKKLRLFSDENFEEEQINLTFLEMSENQNCSMNLIRKQFEVINFITLDCLYVCQDKLWRLLGSKPKQGWPSLFESHGLFPTQVRHAAPKTIRPLNIETFL